MIVKYEDNDVTSHKKICDWCNKEYELEEDNEFTLEYKKGLKYCSVDYCMDIYIVDLCDVCISKLFNHFRLNGIRINERQPYIYHDKVIKTKQK